MLEIMKTTDRAVVRGAVAMGLVDASQILSALVSDGKLTPEEVDMLRTAVEANRGSKAGMSCIVDKVYCWQHSPDGTA